MLLYICNHEGWEKESTGDKKNSGSNVIIFFRRKIWPKYWRFLLKLLLLFSKILSQHCFLRKMSIFSPKIGKNRRKLW
jgi:hypothetical protein